MKPFYILAAASVLLAMPAKAGVLAHYSFDTGYNDVSGNSQNGSLVDGGTAGNSGIISGLGNFKFGNGAMNFSGDRDYIAIPTKSFAAGSSYTIAFWAKKSAGDTGQAADWDMVIGQRDNTNNFIALNDVTGTGLRWRGTANTTDRQADFAVTKDYQWHHYAFVASGTTVTLYLDGQLFGSATSKQTAFVLDTIGEAYTSSADYDFNGQLDEVWVFDEALGANGVLGLYQSNDPYAPLAYSGFHLRFDGDFNDSGTGANNGTPAGTAAVTTDPTKVVSGSGALALDGSDSALVALPAAGSYSATQPWTATWWARRNQLGTSKGMVMGRASNTSDFIWQNDAFNGLRFRSSNATTFDFTAVKDTNLHHYALVADGSGNLSLYVDAQWTQTLTGNTSFTVDSIGKAYPTTSLHYNFSGTLDEVHLAPTALSATQIVNRYEQEKPAATPSAISRVRVFLVGGQSNGDGRADVSGLPLALQSPESDVDFYYKVEGKAGALTTLQPGLSETSQFGPEVRLGRTLADRYANEVGTRVAIIKYCNGGTNLYAQWKAGGDATTTGDGPEYVVFQQTVTAGWNALVAKYPQATLELDAMVWMQGESDAVASYAGSYQTNLTNFIADIGATYGNSLPFVIGRLSTQQTALNATYLNQVRAAQDAVAAADPRTSIVYTEGFPLNSDNLHFGPSGQQSLGSAFADSAAYNTWMVETFTEAAIDAGNGEPNADPDGDGKTNQAEFLAGTDPLTAN